MVKQVVAFGDPVLKAEAQEIEKGHKDLETLINDMWETMYSAEGVGIAAPQVGESIRLFVVDGTPFGEDDEVCHGFKRVMINPVIFCVPIKDKRGEPLASVLSNIRLK